MSNASTAPGPDGSASTRRKPLAIAHRGEPVGHRENTLSGFLAAVRAGADMVETDVKLDADGRVVLLHDDTLDRLWGRPWLIGETHAATLAGLADEHGVSIPTLREGLAVVAGTGVSLLIDMDAPDWAAPSLAVVQAAVGEGWLTPQEVVWCGRPAALRIIRQRDARARIVLSWDEHTADGDLPSPGVLAELTPEAFNPHWPMLTPEVLAWARQRGLQTSCWTVDDDAVMARLCAAGVDAVISNRVHALRKVIDAHAR